MDTRQIRHFLAVAEHRNMLRAAHAIHLSQPALTKSIQNLEAELDVPLFARGPRGMTPTIYGNLLLRHARLLENQGAKAISEIKALKAGRAGRLRLGVANFAIAFLPQVLARLVTDNPGLTFEIVNGTYEDLTELVRQGAIDALAAGFPFVHRAEDLVHEELVAEQFLVVCRRGHPVAAQVKPSLQAVAAQRWIIPNRPQMIVEFMEMMFRKLGLAPPRPAIESGSMTYVKALLLQGDFVTSLPRSLVASELESGELVALPHPYGAVATVEGMIYRADAVHPPALFLLIEAIKAQNAAPTSGFGAAATFGRRAATRGGTRTPRNKRR